MLEHCGSPELLKKYRNQLLTACIKTNNKLCDTHTDTHTNIYIYNKIYDYSNKNQTFMHKKHINNKALALNLDMAHLTWRH